MNKISETEIRAAIHRLAMEEELVFWKRAMDHYHKTGQRTYNEYGIRVDVSERFLKRIPGLEENKI